MALGRPGAVPDSVLVANSKSALAALPADGANAKRAIAIAPKQKLLGRASRHAVLTAAPLMNLGPRGSNFRKQMKIRAALSEISERECFATFAACIAFGAGLLTFGRVTIRAGDLHDATVTFGALPGPEKPIYFNARTSAIQ